jgi:hypothetical protein
MSRERDGQLFLFYDCTLLFVAPIWTILKPVLYGGRGNAEPVVAPPLIILATSPTLAVVGEFR